MSTVFCFLLHNIRHINSMRAFKKKFFFPLTLLVNFELQIFTDSQFIEV